MRMLHNCSIPRFVKINLNRLRLEITYMIDYTPKKAKQEFTGFSHKYSTRLKKTEIISPVSTGYNPRETQKYPSRVTSGGETALRASPQYTGDKMLGITILHKSCLQPVFNSQEAIDAANMRR